ncbi:MAG: hypothetical protein QM791_12135 [Ferruginibacter sp.]
MTATKYLNGVLTVIALCLILITLAVTGILPTATANPPKNPNSFVHLPLNPDGSVSVKLVSGQTMDVNIKEIGGSSYGKLNVNLQELSGRSLISNTLPVNIEEVNGRNVFGSLPVKMEK